MRGIVGETLRGILIVMTGLIVASIGWASDGAVEINAAAAGVGGITPGDAPGYPVTLSRSGRYVLTGDLELPSAGTTGIEILAEAVTVDLNDFSIRGVVTCTSAVPPVCTPSGIGVGIRSTQAYTVVRGGRVLGMGNDCIRLGASARVERVVVARCGDDGIDAGLFAAVRDVQSVSVVGDGISVGGSSRVLDSQAYSSGAFGIHTGTHALVATSQLAGNGQGGLSISEGVVRENSIVGNAGSGVVVDGAASVVGNLVTRNQGHGISGVGFGTIDSAVVALNTIAGNQSSGIANVNDLLVVQNMIADNLNGTGCSLIGGVDTACSVVENTIVRNGQFGIQGPANLGYSTNVLNGNGSEVSAGPIEFGTNLCALDATCP